MRKIRRAPVVGGALGMLGLVVLLAGTLQPPTRQVFTGVGVLDVPEGTVLPDQTVIVEQGVITSIGRGIPESRAGDVIVDGQGLFLMPGLVDMHVHLEWFPSQDVLPLFLLYGVTTVRQMDGRPVHLEWRDAIQRGELLGPFIEVGGQILEGPEPRWDDTRVVTSEAEARTAVQEQAQLGYDFLKVYHTLTPELYHAILDEAMALGLPVVGHIPTELGLSELLEGSQMSIEHLTGLVPYMRAQGTGPDSTLLHLGDRYFAFEMDSVRKRDLIERTKHAQVAITPTISIRTKFLEALASEDPEVPHADMLTEDILGFWYGTHGWLSGDLDSEARSKLRRGVGRQMTFVRELHEAGVPLLLGTDTPQPFLVPGISLHSEIQVFVDAGIPVEDVLRLATQGPAAFLSHLVGSGQIAEGEAANFILVEGNPLQDLPGITRVRGVMLRDQWIPRDSILAQIGADSE